MSHCGSAAALAPYMYNRVSETYDYTVVYNDRHHNKRQRESSSPQNTDHNTTVDQVRASLGARPKQTGQSTASSRPDLPKIVGKSINESIKAAPPKIPKSVYCISNVDPSIDKDTLSSFIEKHNGRTVT